MRVPYVGQYPLIEEGIKCIFDTDGSMQICIIEYRDPVLLQALNQFHMLSMKGIYIHKILSDYRLHESISDMYICNIEIEPREEYILKKMLKKW